MLMDEAFSALDPLIKREMQDQLVELQNKLGKTILFITHDLNEAMRLGDRIAMMRDGRIVQIGTAEQILNDPANDFVAQFVQDVDRTRVLTAGAVMTPPVALVGSEQGPRVGAQADARAPDRHASSWSTATRRWLVPSTRRRWWRPSAPERRPSTASSTDRGRQRAAEHAISPICSAVSADTPKALAVVDDDRRVVGVLARVTLLQALAQRHGASAGRRRRASPSIAQADVRLAAREGGAAMSLCLSPVPRIPVGDAIQDFFDWLTTNLGGFFDAISDGIGAAVDGLI